MTLENVKEQKLLYHLTKLSNMESIIRDGLVSRESLIKNGVLFEDIADSAIISKRKELGLEKYIPFHFHPYSSFDKAVKSTHPADVFVYVCIKRALAKYKNYKILIKHPLSKSECNLYDYAEGFDKIDWEAMRAGALDDYSKQVKMAECLTDETIPAELFQCVYVPDERAKTYVQQLFYKYGITEQPPYVNIQKWF